MPRHLLLIALLLLQPVIINGSRADSAVEAGEALYAICSGCHSPSYHRTGPAHCRLVGRRAGSQPGFLYSDAMQQSDIIWNESTLDRFLTSPLTMIPGTTMTFAGIDMAAKRQQLIQYLMSLDAHHPLCQQDS